MSLYRAQVLLDRTQRDDLERLARDSGRSMSDLLREILADYLERVSREESARQSLVALDRLEEIRNRALRQCGLVDPSLLRELREERDVEIASR